jgi:MoaA/NifB/PqqE/SkfB family radical SAM enzyme
MTRHNLRTISRRAVNYARARLKSPFTDRKGSADEPRAFIEKMLADRDFYTSDRITLPTSAIIETTTRCNLRCIMCARLEDSHPGEDLPYEAFERCMESLVPHLKRIDLNGHGETFLNRHFLRILEQAKENGTFVAITTNATLIDEATADALVRLEMDEMVVSLDAATPALFERIRRGARFDKVLENIDRVNSLKKQYHRDRPHIDVQMVAMKMNIHELPALVRLAHERVKARSVSVIPLKEYPAVEGESLLRYPERALRYIPEARRIAKELGLAFSLSPVLESLLAGQDRGEAQDADTSSEPDGRKTYMSCDDAWKFAFVDCTGRIRPCCGTDRVMGDLGKSTFPEIWYGDEYVTFRTALLSGHPPPECLRCIHRTKFYR